MPVFGQAGQLDTAALRDKLDGYVRGKTKALTPVRRPSAEEQRQRSESRLHEHLKQSRHPWEARGRTSNRLLCRFPPASSLEPLYAAISAERNSSAA